MLTHTQGFRPIAFSLAHHTTTDVMARCMNLVRAWVLVLTGLDLYVVIRHVISDNDSAIIKLVRELFTVARWINCYAHVSKNYVGKYSRKQYSVFKNLGRMLGDIANFHSAVSEAHACAFSEFWVGKWASIEPEVTSKFKKHYLDGARFSWVALACHAGIPKTNNACESFNAIISKLLLGKHRVTLRKFLRDLPGFVSYLAQHAIVVPFPKDGLDIFLSNNLSTPRPCVLPHVVSRVAKTWSDAQHVATQWKTGSIPTFTSTDNDGDCTYFPDEVLFLSIRGCYGSKGRIEECSSVALFTHALAEYVGVLNATSVGAILQLLTDLHYTPQIACLVEKMAVCNSPFALLHFTLGLFCRYKNGACTCRYFKHYGYCRHSLAFDILKGRPVPPKWVSGHIRIICRPKSSKRRRER